MATLEEQLTTQIQGKLQQQKDRGVPVSELAAKLEVRTATVYQLLEGETTPNSKVLCNACRHLRMSFTIDGYRIGALDFPPSQVPPVAEVQLGLFELVASTDGDELNVTVKKRSSPVIELDVRLVG
jgi:transcriptional regulator with XRE-family HTH domain